MNKQTKELPAVHLAYFQVGIYSKDLYNFLDIKNIYDYETWLRRQVLKYKSAKPYKDYMLPRDVSPVNLAKHKKALKDVNIFLSVQLARWICYAFNNNGGNDVLLYLKNY